MWLLLGQILLVVNQVGSCPDNKTIHIGYIMRAKNRAGAINLAIAQAQNDGLLRDYNIRYTRRLLKLRSLRAIVFLSFFLLVFTALHVMQTRYSEENSVRLSVCPSVRPSVCLSVTRVHCDKTVERSVQIYIPYERTFIPLF